MARKSFDNKGIMAKFFTQETQEEQNQQKEHKVQEVTTSLKYEEIKTQGKKGAKLPRINMAFAPTTLKYLQDISRLEGISITEYVNKLVEKDYELKKKYLMQLEEIKKTYR